MQEKKPQVNPLDVIFSKEVKALEREKAKKEAVNKANKFYTFKSSKTQSEIASNREESISALSQDLLIDSEIKKATTEIKDSQEKIKKINTKPTFVPPEAPKKQRAFTKTAKEYPWLHAGEYNVDWQAGDEDSSLVKASWIVGLVIVISLILAGTVFTNTLIKGPFTYYSIVRFLICIGIGLGGVFVARFFNTFYPMKLVATIFYIALQLVLFIILLPANIIRKSKEIDSKFETKLENKESQQQSEDKYKRDVEEYKKRVDQLKASHETAWKNGAGKRASDILAEELKIIKQEEYLSALKLLQVKVRKVFCVPNDYLSYSARYDLYTYLKSMKAKDLYDAIKYYEHVKLEKERDLKQENFRKEQTKIAKERLAATARMEREVVNSQKRMEQSQLRAEKEAKLAYDKMVEDNLEHNAAMEEEYKKHNKSVRKTIDNIEIEHSRDMQHIKNKIDSIY